MDRAYIKVRLLGEGSYGRVYLARERNPPKRLVCVKQLLVAQSRNEVQHMKSVRHPNVVRFLDAFDRVIVMEFCPGGDLRGFLHQKPAPEVREDRVWHWIIQLCLALAHLHTSGIWHRDLKTSNVFLNGSGFLVLGDLGVARKANSPCDLASTIIGTPLYMAPEIWDGKPYDGCCDLWALGCTIYELCMKRTPFEEAKTTPALIRRCLEGKYKALPTDKWSPRIRELIGALLDLDPSRRPTTTQILQDPENEIFISRYLQDRVDAAERSGRKEAEHAELVILKGQLESIGVRLSWPSPGISHHTKPKPATSVTDRVKAQHIELEQRLRLQREAERQEQLWVALQRVQELGVKEQHAKFEMMDTKESTEMKKEAREPHGGVVPRKQVDLQWKGPIQVDKAGENESKSKRRISLMRQAPKVEFAGIPRPGVSITPHAKAFAAMTQSPLSCDIRLLRKHELAKGAAKYKATLDSQFNKQNFKQAEVKENDDDITDGIAQLEAALRQQLRCN